MARQVLFTASSPETEAFATQHLKQRIPRMQYEPKSCMTPAISFNQPKLMVKGLETEAMKSSGLILLGTFGSQ